MDIRVGNLNLLSGTPTPAHHFHYHAPFLLLSLPPLAPSSCGFPFVWPANPVSSMAPLGPLYTPPPPPSPKQRPPLCCSYLLTHRQLDPVHTSSRRSKHRSSASPLHTHPRESRDERSHSDPLISVFRRSLVLPKVCPLRALFCVFAQRDHLAVWADSASARGDFLLGYISVVNMNKYEVDEEPGG